MKKIFLFLLSVIALSQHANAQNIVDANDFFENPAKFNGRTIIFKDIIIRKGVAKDASIGSSAKVSVGSGSASSSAGISTRCTPPRNYEMLEVVFPNGKTKGCFVILKKVANPIPSGKNVTSTITFKADTRTMNKITMIKFIP